MNPWSSNSCKEFLRIFCSFKFNRYGALACRAEPGSNSIWWSTSRRGGRPFGNLLVRTSLNSSMILGTRPQLGPILGPFALIFSRSSKGCKWKKKQSNPHLTSFLHCLVEIQGVITDTLLTSTDLVSLYYPKFRELQWGPPSDRGL